MRVSKQARKQARALYQACLKDGIVDRQKALMLVDNLIQTKPREYIQVLQWFLFLVRQNELRRTAIVETAIEPSSETIAKLKDAVQSLTTLPLIFEFRTNPQLIAGARIQIGDQVWENSISARLKLLKAALTG